MRVPILKARHHLGALTSRGDRAENEDRFKVGLMNEVVTTEGLPPFYFAIIDGYEASLYSLITVMEETFVLILLSIIFTILSRRLERPIQNLFWTLGGQTLEDISDDFILACSTVC